MMMGDPSQSQQPKNDTKNFEKAVAKEGPSAVVQSASVFPPTASGPKVEAASETILIRVSSTPGNLKVEVMDRAITSTVWPIVGFFVLAGAIRIGLYVWRNHRWPLPSSRFSLLKGEVSFAGIGKFEISPNLEDLQIAHRLWTELKTRKAALPFDPDHDVIIEVYDSWYALFGKTRDLLADIPAKLIRQEHSTREIVRISLAVLNEGLRPHLTRWQARYRNWYATQKDELSKRTPQEVQRDFRDYEELVLDLQRVNSGLIEYADQLARLTHE